MTSHGGGLERRRNRFLSTCRGKDLIEVLNDALWVRPEHLNYDPEREEIRFVLTGAHHFRLDDGTYTEWVFSVVADEAPGEYPLDFEGEPFLQDGGCPWCDIELSSHAKRAVYPLCGGLVRLA